MKMWISVGSREGWKCVCNCLYSKWGFRNRISIERRSVTSVYHGSKICGCQQSFLTETAIWFSNDGRKVWAKVLFLKAIIHWKVIHVNYFLSFLFFWHAIFAGPRFVEIQILTTMVTWRNGLSNLLPPPLLQFFRKTCCFQWQEVLFRWNPELLVFSHAGRRKQMTFSPLGI